MKRNGFIESPQAHHECWELLPWIANERVCARDLARVEAHLHACDACTEELATQRRLRDTIRTDDAVVLAPQTSLQKLMQRIDAAETGIDDVETATQADQPTPAVASWRRWLPIAAAFQGAVIAALLATVWWQSRETLTAPRYTTLTSQTTVAYGPVLRVVFAEEVSLEAVSQIVHTLDAQIIAGPSEAGVYTLGLSEGTAHSVPIDDALARLRSDQRVLFAESAVAQRQSP